MSRNASLYRSRWLKLAASLLLVASANFATNTAGLPGCAWPDDSEIWLQDAAEAIEKAASENRDLLLLFTGSDWCPPCIKLKKDVLSQKEFVEQAPNSFVLVKFDFPQTVELSAELQKQNDEWSERFGIEGFPTIVLLDSQQRPYAFTGLREEGPAAYLKHLEALRQTREKRDEAFSMAADKQGIERAELLDQGLSALDPDIVEIYYEDVVNEIGELDSEDGAGLRTKYFAARDRELRKAVMSNISMVARLDRPENAIAFIERALAETRLPIDMWLTAQKTKLRLLRSLERTDEAQQLIDSMISTEGMDAETRQRLIINKVFYMVSQSQNDLAMDELGQQIRSQPENLLLMIAKGELLHSFGNLEEALAAYDQSIMAAAARPEVLVEVVGAKADALFELKRVEEALATLDELAANQNVPANYRAEALLHKALMLRETNRRRAAILSENRAVEIVETPEGKSEIQKLVDQFRRKFAGQSQ